MVPAHIPKYEIDFFYWKVRKGWRDEALAPFLNIRSQRNRVLLILDEIEAILFELAFEVEELTNRAIRLQLFLLSEWKYDENLTSDAKKIEKKNEMRMQIPSCLTALQQLAKDLNNKGLSDSAKIATTRYIELTTTKWNLRREISVASAILRQLDPNIFSNF